MILSAEETLKIIRLLFTRFVPVSLDHLNVLETLDAFEKSFFHPATTKCPECGVEMFCPTCANFDVNAETSVTVSCNGKEVYSD